MQVVIRTQDLELGDLLLAKNLKFFEDRNLVEDIRDDKELFEFVCSILNETDFMTKHFEHITKDSLWNMTPELLYRRIMTHHPSMPKLYLASKKDGRYKNIVGIHHSRDLKAYLDK